jgi:polyhydroxyalkanoate synthase
MISWVNPDEALAHKSFTDYMMEGPLAAMREIKALLGTAQLNILGYCLGGTLLGALMAWIEANKAKPEVAALPVLNCATFLVSMLDFRDVGDISVFIDDEQLNALEAHMNARGYLEGSAMATTFNMLRANDLIWSFVVNNYLMGKEPFPFDLLYWNADSTRMPAAMHSFYLREMYQRNRLAKPGALNIAGTPIDLTRITTPAFFLSTRDDHIAPWRTTYYGAKLMQGPTRFVLSGSGHIAGVVNPPEAKKYGYWTNDFLPPLPDDWMKGTVAHEGSWWPEWEKWLASYSGGTVPARQPGAGLENAPGSYVSVKAA